MKTYGIIMAGGGGTRFWPLSRHKEPKQLLNLSGKDLMINETIDRIALICEKEDIFVVTNQDQAPKVQEASKGRLRPDHILSEPCARNTAACIGFAAAEILEKYGDGLMCIFPADHHIEDWNEFARILNLAKETAERDGCLLTLGIRPSYPSTGYGYIKFEGEGDQAKQVLEFREKPDLETAKSYMESGNYAWNSGMFVWKASVIMEKFAEYLPEVYRCLNDIRTAMNTPEERQVIEKIYPTSPSVSIDYGIMEKCPDVKVIPAEMGWNDVGSWDNMGVLHPADEKGNIFVGKHVNVDTEGCITYSKNRLIATLGLKDIIIVETDDAVLVCDRERAQDVKEIAELLKERGETEYL